MVDIDTVSDIERALLIHSYSALSPIDSSRTNEEWIKILAGCAIHRWRLHHDAEHPLQMIWTLQDLVMLLALAVTQDLCLSSVEAVLGLQLLLVETLKFSSSSQMYGIGRRQPLSRYVTGTYAVQW